MWGTSTGPSRGSCGVRVARDPGVTGMAFRCAALQLNQHWAGVALTRNTRGVSQGVRKSGGGGLGGSREKCLAFLRGISECPVPSLSM